MIKGIIYCAYNKVNGKRYIGRTIQRLSERKCGHYNHDPHLYFHRALRKYPPENWEWSVIEECNSFEELQRREIYWIAYYDSTNPDTGYNILAGGDGSLQSQAQVRYARERLVASLNTERKCTKGIRNVRCIETEEVFKSAAEAGRCCGITYSHITEAANGIKQTAGGYHWEWCIELSYFPNALYCEELDTTYLTFNEAQLKGHFSGVKLGKTFKESGNKFIYAGYTFYKLNPSNE